MSNDAALREHLIQLLRGGHAHATFDDAVKSFPPDKIGIRPKGAPLFGLGTTRTYAYCAERYSALQPVRGR